MYAYELHDAEFFAEFDCKFRTVICGEQCGIGKQCRENCG